MSEAQSAFVRLTNWKEFNFHPWREMSVGALVMMELSWVVPWYRALTPRTFAVTTGRAFAVLGGLLVSALLTYRAMNYLRLRVRLRQGILFVLLLFSIMIGIKTLLYSHEQISLWNLLVGPIEQITNLQVLLPDEFLVMVVVILAWWRGISIARVRVSPRNVIEKFQVGFFMLVMYIFLNTLITGVQIGELLYLYLFAGLLAMGSARISVISHLRGGQRNPFNRKWFIGMLTITIGLVGVVAFVVSLVTGENDLISQLVLSIWGLLMFILLLLLSPLILLALYIFEWYLNQAGDKPLEAVRDLTDVFNQLFENLQVLAEIIYEFAEKTGLLKLLSWLPNLRPMVLLGIVSGLTIIVLILIGLRLRIANRREISADERDWVLNRGELLRMLRKAIESRLRQFTEGMANFRQGRRIWTAARIRRIYCKMMDMASEFEHPRMEAETPLEFIETLEKLFPLVRAEVLVITQAYHRVRYGEFPETRFEVEEVEGAWESVKKAGEDFRSNKIKISQSRLS